MSKGEGEREVINNHSKSTPGIVGPVLFPTERDMAAELKTDRNQHTVEFSHSFIVQCISAQRS